MLGDDIAAALPGLQAEAESRMSETVTVGVYEDATDTNGDPTRSLTYARYQGKGRIRFGSRGVVNANGPSMPVAIQEPYLSLPVTSTLLRIGDELTVTASPDPGLVGRWFRVAGAAISGQVTAHRYPLEEVN